MTKNPMLYATMAMELKDARAKLAAATAERASYGDMMAERLGECENERDAARAEYRLLAERAKRVCEYYACNTADWITLMTTVGYEPPLDYPGDDALRAARAEAAEYRTLVDRCRERNKELGAEAEELREQVERLKRIIKLKEANDNSR